MSVSGRNPSSSYQDRLTGSPQELQHSAAGGGRRDRPPPARYAVISNRHKYAFGRFKPAPQRGHGRGAFVAICAGIAGSRLRAGNRDVLGTRSSSSAVVSRTCQAHRGQGEGRDLWSRRGVQRPRGRKATWAEPSRAHVSFGRDGDSNTPVSQKFMRNTRSDWRVTTGGDDGHRVSHRCVRNISPR